MALRDQFKTRTTRRRVSQRDIIPTGVKGRQMGDFIYRTSVSASAVTVANGAQNVNQVVISNQDDKRILAIVERATYVDSVVTTNLLPGGSGIDESQFVYIHNVARVKLDGTLNDGNEMVDQLYIENNTGGQITLYFYIQVRYIINEGGSGTSAAA